MVSEIVVHGDIGTDIRSADFLAALREAERADDEIAIRINSFGGDVFSGVAMANAVRESPATVSVVVDGVAASAASLIAIAARTVSMFAGSFLMIHEPWALTVGNMKEHTRTAASLQKIALRMADAYALRMGIARDQALSLMAAETWFDAKEAVAAGLATHLSNENATAVPHDSIAARHLHSVPSDIWKTKSPNFDLLATQLELDAARAA